MFLQRSAFAAARRAAVSPIVKRSFTSSFVRRTPLFPWFPSINANSLSRRSSTRERFQCWKDKEIRGYAKFFEALESTAKL
jgi:hypothetical protein